MASSKDYLEYILDQLSDLEDISYCRNKTRGLIDNTYYFNWITAGRPYAADVWDYDVYSEIGNYTKPVLLMHGDRDGIVPTSYAEHAAEVYPDVEYYVIRGGGHGFYGNALEDAFSHILEYLQKIAIL